MYSHACMCMILNCYSMHACRLYSCVHFYKYCNDYFRRSFCVEISDSLNRFSENIHVIMLQTVIYYIVTVILTKELVIANDNCTEDQFKTPFSYVGESCEDIYNKNTKSHMWPGYYTIAYKVYCGMSGYTGSSCENIFKKYPEIHRINPKENSGYYRLSNSQWTYCDMSDIAAGAADFISMCSVVEVGESRIKSTNYNYQSVLPGISCENIYNSNKGSHNSPGYYWIASRVYCGMNYTESSCEDIYNNNPETHNKSGYYRIKVNNKYQWTNCNMSTIQGNGDFISTCAGVGGGWRRIVNINISAGDDCPGEWRKATQSGVSFCRVASNGSHTCSSANFSTNGISYQRVCGRARGYQKGDTVAFYGAHSAYARTIDEDYVSGLSITYSSNPRQHIWTFASGRGERYDNPWNCPCSVNGGYNPSSFVGKNYYCESGSINAAKFTTHYFNDILWDGAECVDNCCDDITQPWFLHHLRQTTKDDIEVRICARQKFSRGSTLIDQLELYVQ